MSVHSGPNSYSYFDGSTSAQAAPSAKSIKVANNQAANGVYWINDNGTPKQVYCDMTTDDGGWMLYQSFASTNTLTPAQNPAWDKNNILIGDLSNSGWSLTYYTTYRDGNSGSSYSHRSEWFGFFYSGGPNGLMDMTSWNGPPYIRQLRIRHGIGMGSYSGASGYLSVNGGPETYGGSGAGATTDTTSDFDPAGSGNLIRLRETGIYGISWIYMR